MALVALIFLLPWLGAAVIPYLRPLPGRHLGRLALVPPAASFLIALTFVASTSHDQEVRHALPWFPGLGVNFSLWIDGLLDVIAVNTVGLILVLDIQSGSHAYVDAALVIALLLFLGTVSLAKYLGGGTVIDRGHR